MKTLKHHRWIVVVLGGIALAGLFACAEPAPRQEATEERPDAWVTTKVKTKLTADPQINPFRIDVDTQEGVVSLNGEVRSEADEDRAVELARNTEGVREVINNLTVLPAADESADGDTNAAQDALTTTAVKTQLLAAANLSGLAIEVDTAGGVVSLTGTVESDEQRDRAEEIAKAMDNVVEVINNLEVQG